MRRILKEPLLHFLILGAALFAVYEWSAGSAVADFNQQEEIVITEGRINSLSQMFEKVWTRPPTALELEGLIEGHIREDVLYREALAMGLDRDDVIVRRRLRQKIEFLSEDLASLREPSTKELQEFLETHPEKFRGDTRFSFDQVYLNSNNRGESVNADALALLGRLQRGEVRSANSGDRAMISRSFENEPEREIERTLGSQFVALLRNVPQGSWHGPIASAYGLHLVNIRDRKDGELPELAEIRDLVIREWTAVMRKEANEAFYQSLLKRYKITIEKPEVLSSAQLSLVEPKVR